MRNDRKGMTLVEIMMVVLVLSIMAMIVVPKISVSSDDARESALLTDLRTAREMIRLYKVEHHGRSPHVNEIYQKDTGNFVARMTQKTDPDGALNPNGSCGPYLREWPSNPYSSSDVAQDIKFGKNPPSPRDGSTGWYYATKAHQIYPNSGTGGESAD